MDLSYILNHLGEDRERYYDAVSPPIMQTSNFAFPTVAAFREALADEQRTAIYSRGQNPTLVMLNKKLAALDGAEDALCFSSGVSAISAAVLAHVQAGDHIVCVHKPYGWTRTLIQDWLSRFGVESTFVDGTKVENWAAALRPNTRLLMLESPNSLTLELQDLPALAKLARSRGIATILDNSYAGPLNPSPLEWGIDMLCYSGTKYHGGHSDVVCGVLSGSRETIKKIFHHEFMTLGQILSPMNAWLVLRSLRTLEVRMQRIAQSTPVVVEWLAQRPEVERIIYPLHPSHPQYDLACQQMLQPTGLFSILLKTKEPARIEAFVNRLNRFLMAVSWGGHESLVLPSIIFGDPANPNPDVPINLVRFYIGLEDPQVLIADLQQALTELG